MTFLFIVATFIIIGVYFVAIFLLLIGWKRLPVDNSANFEGKEFISIVIPFRNESANLLSLVSCLFKQELAAEKYEILFVNDHSTDDSVEILESKVKTFPQIHLIHLPHGQNGKKAALKLGVSLAKGNYIVTTDADCTMGSKWLLTIHSYISFYQPAMLIGPLVINHHNHYLGHFQQLEQSALMASTAGSAGLGMPVMCSGANLCFRKEIHFIVSENLKMEVASGDDMFLLMAVKKKYGAKSVQFLKSRDAMVFTKPANNIKSFLQQRTRWASKARFYNDIQVLSLAAIVFLITSLECILFLAGIFVHDFWAYFILVIFIKSIPDFLLLSSYARFEGSGKELKWFLPVQVLYPFYVVVTSALGLFFKTKWKQRKV